MTNIHAACSSSAEDYMLKVQVYDQDMVADDLLGHCEIDIRKQPLCKNIQVTQALL